MADGRTLRSPVESLIFVDDREASEIYPLVREVRVETSRRGAAVATLVLDAVRTEAGTWPLLDEGLFRPWRRIRILARFGEEREEVMRGFIQEVKADCPQEMSGATVTVISQDESLALDRQHLRRAWSREDAPLTDGQIAQQIAADHGLAADVDSGLTHTTLHVDATAIRFLQERAEANGFELLVRAGTLRFRLPDLGAAPQATILVYAGNDTNCLRFAASHDGHKPDQVRVIRAAERGTGTEEQTLSPDLPLLGREDVGSDRAGLGSFVWTLPRPPGPTAAEAQARAQARANENAWKVAAEGELDGALYGHVLLTHGTVRVDGVGDAYGGLYYVDEVRHTFSPEGYRQAFKLLRNAIGDQRSWSIDRLAAVR